MVLIHYSLSNKLSDYYLNSQSIISINRVISRIISSIGSWGHTLDTLALFACFQNIGGRRGPTGRTLAFLVQDGIEVEFVVGIDALLSSLNFKKRALDLKFSFRGDKGHCKVRLLFFSVKEKS